LWYDEAFSVVVARLPWAQLLAATAGDVHPPVYYAALKMWIGATDALGVPVEPAARLFSVLLSTLALGLFWGWLGWHREAGHKQQPQGREVAWVIACYMPGSVFYAAEARMYSLLAVWVLAAAYLLWRDPLTLAGDLLRLSGAGVCLGLAALTHNIGLVYAVVLMLAYFVRGKTKARLMYDALLVTGAAIVTYAPWIDTLLQQTGAVTTGYWTWLPNLSSLAYTLLRAMVPAGPVAWPWEQLVFLLIAALTTWALIARWSRSALAVRVLALGVPVLAFVLSHVLRTGILLHRTLIPVLPFIAVLWADLWPRATAERAVLATLVAVALLAVNVGYLSHGRHAEDWHELAYIEGQPGDVVYSLGAIAIPYRLYGHGLPFVALPAAGKPPGTGLSAATLDALGVTQARLEDVPWRRAWLFYYAALPGMVARDAAYFARLRAAYPGHEIAPYAESLGDQVIVKGGLWLLQQPSSISTH